MKPLLLLAGSLLLFSCTTPSPYYTGSSQSTAAFIDGHRGTLSLREISYSRATVDQLDFITKNFVYNEATCEFTTTRPISYHPYTQQGHASSADNLYKILGPGAEPVVTKINSNPKKFAQYLAMKASNTGIVFLFGNDGKLVDVWSTNGQYGAPRS